MNAGRRLFGEGSSQASLWPITAALLALVVVALVGFAVALWHRVAQASGPAQREPAASGTYENGGEQRPASTPARAPGTWV